MTQSLCLLTDETRVEAEKPAERLCGNSSQDVTVAYSGAAAVTLKKSPADQVYVLVEESAGFSVMSSWGMRGGVMGVRKKIEESGSYLEFHLGMGYTMVLFLIPKRLNQEQVWR